jgi:low affinity Fe/Cu permease
MRSVLPIGVFSSGGQEKASTFFARMAHATAAWSGKPAAFLTAVAVVLVWGISVPIFHYSDTWQLVINTGTTIVTFLMVFLIQNTQNRDTLALQIKLSELIVAMKGADNKVAAIEDAPDEELERAHEKVKRKVEKKS